MVARLRTRHIVINQHIIYICINVNERYYKCDICGGVVTVNQKYTQHAFAKRCIYDALMSLMETKELHALTITEIANRAGVSRMAYYRNFESKVDILLSYVDDLFLSYINDLKTSRDFSFQSFIMTALGIFRKHHALMREIAKEKLEFVLISQFEGYIEAMSSMIFRKEGTNSDYVKYYSGFLAGGAANIILRWVCGGMMQSEDEMTRMILDFVNNEALLNLSQNRDPSKHCFLGDISVCSANL